MLESNSQEFNEPTQGVFDLDTRIVLPENTQILDQASSETYFMLQSDNQVSSLCLVVLIIEGWVNLGHLFVCFIEIESQKDVSDKAYWHLVELGSSYALIIKKVCPTFEYFVVPNTFTLPNLCYKNMLSFVSCPQERVGILVSSQYISSRILTVCSGPQL